MGARASTKYEGEHKASPLPWTTKPPGKRGHWRGDPCTLTWKDGDQVLLCGEICIEGFSGFINGGLSVAIEGYCSLSVDMPAYLFSLRAVVEHACLFVDAQEQDVGQEVKEAGCQFLPKVL